MEQISLIRDELQKPDGEKRRSSLFIKIDLFVSIRDKYVLSLTSVCV